jgi:hypothetical protein
LLPLIVRIVENTAGEACLAKAEREGIAHRVRSYMDSFNA